jgi:glycosyltransferase involved in cell wall biosynthesis
MTTLGYARRVPLAISGALRRFAQDPARGLAALERALPGVRMSQRGVAGPVAVDRAVARDRYDEAEAALRGVPLDAPERAGCELAVAGLAGRLSDVATATPRDTRCRRAVRTARRQLAVLGQGLEVPDATAKTFITQSGAPRILHVVTNSLPITQAGSTIRTHRIACAQRDVGWDAHVVTRPGYPVTHGDLRTDNPQVIDTVPYHRLLPLLMPSDDQMSAVYAQLLDGLVSQVRPMVLHAASDHVNALVALSVGERRGIPVAYEARTFFEDMWLARHGGEASRDADTFTLLRERHTEVLRSADVVTTLGQAMRDEIVARGVDPDRVFITPNAVPMEFLQPRDMSASRRQLGLADAMWIGSVATVNDDEGMDTMVSAVRLLRDAGIDARALVVGDGPGLASVRRLAEQLRVPLTAPGRVPVSQVRPWFDVLDVFALPRRDSDVHRSVTPLKPLEAQARGIPVVGSDLPAIAEVLAPGSRLVSPEDPQALAAALTELADPQGREAEGQAARQWIAQTRTWPSVMEAYHSAYALVGVPV